MLIRTIGYLLIGSALYICMFSGIYVASAVLLTKGIVLNYGLLREFQEDFYVNRGYRKIWQMQRDCVVLDETLIYVPKIGKCRFRNPEFDTTLHFDETGRHRTPTPSFRSESGIVVLGDSMAMGWGVNDHETFANIIQEELQIPVYNLAVSSYGTVRELVRLQQSDLITAVDTILLQYSANDITENASLDNQSAFLEAKTYYQDVFNGVRPIGDRDVFRSINRAFAFAVEKPVRDVGDAILLRKKKDQFGPHYQALVRVLKKFAALLDNKRVVVFETDKYRFDDFPAGKDKTLGNVEFVDLKLDANDHYVLDGHLNPIGHKAVGKALSRYLKTP